MSFAKTYSAEASGLTAKIIDVEVDLSKGLHSFSIVGLPDKGVEESRDRVSAAVKNSGFTSPKQKNQKVVVSLAPADLKKEGPAFDVAIALAYLLAAEEISFEPKGKLFLGELSLDGEVRAISGVLPLTLEARRKGFAEIFVPKENAREAALVTGITVFPISNLRGLIDHLVSEKMSAAKKERATNWKITPQPKTELADTHKPAREYMPDFGDIKGQNTAKRGLEIAAAGGHNVAMYGPPGTGKTMLAKAFRHILPPLSFDEMLEVTGIHSIAGSLAENFITEPPIRSPHHTASYVSLVGGGAIPKPGEVTLAHRGVLFLDEFPEFDRRVIDSLREPIEERVVSISRAKGSVRFPAHFILIAAMNPCPCGNFGIKGKPCICLPIAIERYKRKISGPIIDRIDLWVEVSRVEHERLSDGIVEKETEGIRKNVLRARGVARARFEKAGRTISQNGEMNARDLGIFAPLSPAEKQELNTAATHYNISARAYHKVIKVARTIADLEDSERVTRDHIMEALQYRPKQNG